MLQLVALTIFCSRTTIEIFQCQTESLPKGSASNCILFGKWWRKRKLAAFAFKDDMWAITIIIVLARVPFMHTYNLLTSDICSISLDNYIRICSGWIISIQQSIQFLNVYLIAN